MGEYMIPADEFIDGFEDFLRNFEGNVSAECVAEAWNRLAEKYEWSDKLFAK